jgi:hypothetical protein
VRIDATLKRLSSRFVVRTQQIVPRILSCPSPTGRPCGSTAKPGERLSRRFAHECC